MARRSPRVRCARAEHSLIRFARAECPLIRIALLWLAALLQGCNAIPRAVERALCEPPSEYWVVVPEQRECLPALQLFLAHTRARGFPTRVVSFDAERGPVAAWKHVVRRLRDRPGSRSAYLLVLATPGELPMGPWQLEGADAPVESDLPLALELDLDEAASLSRDELVRACIPAPRWIVGRIPFAEPGLCERVLLASVEYGSRTASRLQDCSLTRHLPFALLGARRFLIPGDSSFALGRAKAALVRAGIPSELWADAPQCDRKLGQNWVQVKRKAWVEVLGEVVRVYVGLDELPMGRPLAEVELSEEVSPDFVARWVATDPELVYLLSHGNADLHSLGRALLGTGVLAGWDASRPARAAPAHPALLLASGCSIGKPDGQLVRELFERGFIATFAGSSANNGPLPLVPALNAECNVADFLARGASIGCAVQLAKAVYVEQSRATLTWWLLPLARAVWAVNLASYVIYGDPSLGLGALRGP